jgi:molecular chaperone GrpE (heat shock protein)
MASRSDGAALAASDVQSMLPHITRYVAQRDAANLASKKPVADLWLEVVTTQGDTTMWSVVGPKRLEDAFVIELMPPAGDSAATTGQKSKFPDPDLEYTFIALKFRPTPDAPIQGVARVMVSDSAARASAQLAPAARRSTAATPAGLEALVRPSARASTADAPSTRRSASASSSSGVVAQPDDALSRLSAVGADSAPRRSASASSAGASTAQPGDAIARLSTLRASPPGAQSDARASSRSSSAASSAARSTSVTSARSSVGGARLSTVARQTGLNPAATSDTVLAQLEAAGRRTSAVADADQSLTGRASAQSTGAPSFETARSDVADEPARDLHAAVADARLKCDMLGVELEGMRTRVDGFDESLQEALDLTARRMMLHVGTLITTCEERMISRDVFTSNVAESDRVALGLQADVRALRSTLELLQARVDMAERSKSHSPSRSNAQVTLLSAQLTDKLDALARAQQEFRDWQQIADRRAVRSDNNITQLLEARSGATGDAADRLLAVESDTNAITQRVESLEESLQETATRRDVQNLADRIEAVDEHWNTVYGTGVHADDVDAVVRDVRDLDARMTAWPTTLETVRCTLALRVERAEQDADQASKRVDARLDAHDTLIDALTKQARRASSRSDPAPADASGDASAAAFGPLVQKMGELLSETQTQLARCEAAVAVADKKASSAIAQIVDVGGRLDALESAVRLKATDGSVQTLQQFADFVSKELRKAKAPTTVRIALPLDARGTADVIPVDHGDAAAPAGTAGDFGDDDDLASATDGEHEVDRVFETRNAFDPVHWDTTLPFHDPRLPDAITHRVAVIGAVTEVYNQAAAKYSVKDAAGNTVTANQVRKEILDWIRKCFADFDELTKTVTQSSKNVDAPRVSEKEAHSLFATAGTMVRALHARQGEALRLKMLAIIHAVENPLVCSFASTMANHASVTAIRDTRGSEVLDQFIKPPSEKEKAAAAAAPGKKAAPKPSAKKSKSAPQPAAAGGGGGPASRARSQSPKRNLPTGATSLRGSNTVPAPATRSSSKNGRDSP